MKACLNTSPTTKQAERIRLARIALTRVDAFPYYYPIAFGMTLVETDRVPTMAVDNRLRLYYNPTWVATLSEPELLGVFWHETQHILREHVFERGVMHVRFLKGAIADGLLGEEAVKRLQEVYRDLLGEEMKGVEGERSLEDLLLTMAAKDLANIAEDLEINDDAEGVGLKLPSKGAFIENFGLPRGLTAEEYSARLLEEAKRRARGGGGGTGTRGKKGGHSQESGGGNEKGEGQGGGGGGFLDALVELLKKSPRDILVEEFAQALEREYPELQEVGVSEVAAKVAVRQSAEEILRHAAKEPGSVPAGILRAAEAILKPRVDWKSVLRAKVGKALVDLNARERPTYHRPHRRQGALGNVLLPGAYGLKPEVAVVIDTSGSMGEKELGQALGELKALLRHQRPTVYTVDAEVHTAERVFSLEQVRLLGGGGTDMGRGIEKAVEDGHELVVVLTDGYTPWPKKPPRATVVVGIIHPKGEEPPEVPPWAKAVPIPVSPAD
jgi:predicted metal-dependent peptidase